jgi:hypothetical protein
MSDKQVIVKNSTNLFGVVGLILVILKLAGIAPVATWSWWLVTMPFWLGLAISLAFLLVIAGMAAVAFLIAWWADR